ncbi:DUF2339 domain-containing protein [Caulobacter sp. KR2-114]|uniref:DUF2339 domain-containing protein n=1 Tax=Caulobacter sp. KR2-114 TaxID=3400912 RepID=UPI003C10242E
MAWLAILGLGVWLFIEHAERRNLGREVERLRAALQSLMARAAPVQPEATLPPEVAPPEPASTATPRTDWAAAQPAPMSLPPAEPARAADPAPAAATRGGPSPALLEIRARAADTLPQAESRPPPSPAAPRPAPAVSRESLERWLSEKGLAWIGGVALVAGGAFLVGYAVQHGILTPLVRIVAACLLGGLMLAAGEAIRRGRLAGFGGHSLAAAIISGAGAAVLYGAVWAAHGLYGFIGAGTCAMLLASISAGLMGLAFLHGEALGLLALGGAFAAPLIASRGGWGVEAMTLYLGLLIAVGMTIGWLRRWGRAAGAVLLGAGAWALLAAFGQDSLKCLLLGLEPLAALALLAHLRPRPAARGVTGGAMALATLAGFLALAWAYAGARPEREALIAAAALPLLVAGLQRRGHAGVWGLGAVAGTFALAAAVARVETHPSLLLAALWAVQILALAGAALWSAAGPQAGSEAMAAGATGAIGAVAVGLAGAVGYPADDLAPIGPAAACIALAFGAWRLALRRREPLELDYWSGGAAAALLTALAVALSWRWGPMGFTAATLGLAMLGRRLGWRAVMGAAAASAALAFLALLGPDLLVYGVSGPVGAGWVLAAGLALAAASFAAARIVRAQRAAAEALRTLSPLAALAGAFVFLRWLAGGGHAPGASAALDLLTEASLRTVLIAVAGLVSLARRPDETTAFGRWRGHLLLGAAGLHAALLQVIAFNPRWSPLGDVVAGVPVIDALALAYLAPAALFAAAAWRIYPAARRAGRAYLLVALGFGLLWIGLEVRRLFHGPHLGGGIADIGAGEGLAASLALFAVAALAGRARGLAARAGAHPAWADVAAGLPAVRLTATAFAVLVAGLWANPCWGAPRAPLGGAVPLAGVLGGYALATVLAAWLAGAARRGGHPREADAETLAAMGLGLTLATLGVRAAFQGPALGLGHPAGEMEMWTYSAVWAAVGLGFIGASRRGGGLFLRAGVAVLLGAAAKVFLVDTASLSGVVRAGSFLALGVLLLAAALTARRLGRPLGEDPAANAP